MISSFYLFCICLLFITARIQWKRKQYKTTDKSKLELKTNLTKNPSHNLMVLNPSKPYRLHHLIISPLNSVSHLVLVIPGNPGVPGFYDPFMRHLYSLSKETLEVCCLSHSGHSTYDKLRSNELYNLSNQIEHKLLFIKEKLKLNPSLRLTLVGHSIGAYMVLKIMDHFSENIDSIILLQPAVMHISKTPNGKVMMPLFKSYKLISFLWNILSFLPYQLKKWIVILIMGKHHDPVIINSAITLTDAQVVANILYLALHEMKEVLDVTQRCIKEQEKISFIYANNDKWCPNDYVNQLETIFPSSKHQKAFPSHAFMTDFQGSQEIASRVWDWIKNRALVAEYN